MERAFDAISWTLWRKRRQTQLLIGRISAVFFLVAVLALLDGLQMLVRTSVDEISLLAGATEGLSGPCPFQNPVESDLEVRFTPKEAPLHFALEGFFAGYLLGNGMWRGQLTASEQAESGDCQVVIAFRGLPEAQRFTVHVFADYDDYRKASPSFSTRFLGFAPFLLSAVLAGTAFAFGLVTFVLGRMNLTLLRSVGWAEIFRTKAESDGTLTLWSSAVGGEGLVCGDRLSVISPEGEPLGTARVRDKVKNVLTLVMGEAEETVVRAEESRFTAAMPSVLTSTVRRSQAYQPVAGPEERERKAERPAEKVVSADPRVVSGCLVHLFPEAK